MSDFQLEPGIAGFLFKQFSRELQGKIVRQLYNAKVHVQPDATNDSVRITIKHKLLPIEYTENLSEIASCIRDEAENDGVIRELARTIVGNYKDHIWHMFFYDYKKRQDKKEEVPVIEENINSIETSVEQ